MTHATDPSSRQSSRGGSCSWWSSYLTFYSLHTDVNFHHFSSQQHRCSPRWSTRPYELFPNSSCIWLLSSTNSAGAIRYGAIDTGLVLGTRSIENSTSLLGGNPDTSSGNTSPNLCTISITDVFSSSSTSRWVNIMKHYALPWISFITPWDNTNSGSSELENNTLFSRQSIRMWLVESQSIPKITSNSCKGKQIRFTLYLRLSTSIGHLTHNDDVLTKPDVVVDTTSSHYSSHTGRPNHFT